MEDIDKDHLTDSVEHDDEALLLQHVICEECELLYLDTYLSEMFDR